MLYIDQHKHIKSRADFFSAMARAIDESLELLKVAPADGVVTAILRQLETIRAWTDQGREPTQEERWKPRIGLLVMRELEWVTDPRIELRRERSGLRVRAVVPARGAGVGCSRRRG
jgi:hypothetical protein